MNSNFGWLLAALLAPAILSAAHGAYGSGRSGASSQEDKDQVLFQQLYGSTPPKTLAECEQFFSALVRTQCQNKVTQR